MQIFLCIYLIFSCPYANIAIGNPLQGWKIPRNKNSVVSSYHQPHSLQLPPVFGPGFHRINSGRVDARMSKDVRQTDNILLQSIVHPRKQVPQIVGKNLCLRHSRRPAQLFHIRPDVAAVQGSSRTGDEHRPAFDPLRLYILQQRFLQLSRQKDRPVFPLVIHLGPSDRKSVV